MLAKRACEVGATNAIQALAPRYTGKVLKESTVRTWMNKYKKELVERRKLGKSLDIVWLENERMGLKIQLPCHTCKKCSAQDFRGTPRINKGHR